jgi:hypothetical protein
VIDFSCSIARTGVEVSAASTGAYPPWWQATRVVVHGVRQRPRSVVDATGSALPHEYDATRHVATLQLAGATAVWTARLAY